MFYFSMSSTLQSTTSGRYDKQKSVVFRTSRCIAEENWWLAFRYSSTFAVFPNLLTLSLSRRCTTPIWSDHLYVIAVRKSGFQRLVSKCWNEDVLVAHAIWAGPSRPQRCQLEHRELICINIFSPHVKFGSLHQRNVDSNVSIIDGTPIVRNLLPNRSYHLF